MLRKSLIAFTLLAASAGVMADSDTRVYGSVVIADPNFSVAIASGPYYPGYHVWAPPPGYYYPKHYSHHKHYQHHPHHYYKNHHRHHGGDGGDRGDYGYGGRGGRH